jgi:hypothetical protein
LYLQIRCREAFHELQVGVTVALLAIEGKPITTSPISPLEAARVGQVHQELVSGLGIAGRRSKWGKGGSGRHGAATLLQMCSRRQPETLARTAHGEKKGRGVIF